MCIHMHVGELGPEWQSAMKRQSEPPSGQVKGRPSPLHLPGNVALGGKRHAILNSSLIVPPTLGRNKLCSSQSPQSNVSAVEG
jgi:hypothetical protein